MRFDAFAGDIADALAAASPQVDDRLTSRDATARVELCIDR
jgi:hypothetical protein